MTNQPPGPGNNVILDEFGNPIPVLPAYTPPASSVFGGTPPPPPVVDEPRTMTPPPLPTQAPPPLPTRAPQPLPVAPVQPAPTGGALPTRAPVGIPPAPTTPVPSVPTAPPAPPASARPVPPPRETLVGNQRPTPPVPVPPPPARTPQPVPSPAVVSMPVAPIQPLPLVGEDEDEFDAEPVGEKTTRTRKGSVPNKNPQGVSPRINRSRTKKGTGSARRDRMLVTERDRLVMSTLARYRFATLEHIRRVMDTSEDMARRRLNRLEDSGYIKSYRLEHNGVRILGITDNGLAYIHSSLSVPRFSVKSLGHTLASTDVGLAYEAHGELVVTEREIRALDLRGVRPGQTFAMEDLEGDNLYMLDPATGNPVLDPAKLEAVETINKFRSWALVTGRDGRAFTKIPDLVLDRPAQYEGVASAVAIEVELTQKAYPGEYEQLLRAYAESGRYAKVLYMTPDTSVRRLVDEAAAKLGLQTLVEVRRFVPSTQLPGYAGHVARGRGDMRYSD